MIVVTGAAGHAGANLVRALAAQGRPVRALAHLDRRALEGLDIEVVSGDIRDPDSLLEAFKGAEVVYHLAAVIAIGNEPFSLLESVNVGGTRNVVEACLRCGVRRLVHFSSIHTLTDTSNGSPVDEACPLVASRRYPAYDRTKAAAEGAVYRGIEEGLDAVIISPTAIIGPHDYKPSHFGEALLRLANGQLPALVSGGFNWVDARDVVFGAMRAEEIAPCGAKYLLSGHWVALREVAKMAAELTGVKAPSSICPMWLARVGAPFVSTFDRLAHRRPLYTSTSLQALRGHRHISHEKATRELGYNPRPFRETLFDTLKWFEAQGKLAHPLKERAGKV
ncbi:MAG: NAD-dependent epimerase/dehydratase family protein [Dehalococcoidia bacterium]|jgi:dihydroflavonol-4-reductase